jgi:hypothetical protein
VTAPRVGYTSMHTMLHHRHYTREQANRELTLVRTVVNRIRDARRTLADVGFDGEFATLAEVTGGAWPGAGHARAALEISLGFDRLEELDVVVRDLDGGLIDFPSLLDGEEVYLCWSLDEPTVGHWHGVEAGYGGRHPLD